MQPPIFSTPISRFEDKRKREAIAAQIEIGGKIFCIHDYVPFGPAIKKHMLDWGEAHVCCKCGKRKVFANRIVQPIPYSNHY